MPPKATKSSPSPKSSSSSSWRRMKDLLQRNRTVQIGVGIILLAALTFTLLFTLTPATPATTLASQTAKSTTSPTSPSSSPSSSSTKSAADTQSTSGVSSSASSAKRASRTPPSVVSAKILTVLPHDSSAFTQGLLIHDGVLYESTGLEGRSQLRKIDLTTGTVLESYAIPSNEFGEGLCLYQNQFYQITWRNHHAYVYDLDTFTSGPKKTWSYDTEGWGITTYGDELIMSDGSSMLYFLDPNNFEVKRKLQVKWLKNGKLNPVHMLNELEFIRGYIYANIWMTNFIILISPTTGHVLKVIDATALHPNPQNREMTLNGIAWDEKQEKLYITGKLWPTMFEIEFVGVESD